MLATARRRTLALSLRIRPAAVDDVDAVVAIYCASKLASLPELIADYDRDTALLAARSRRYIAEGSTAQMATGDGFVLIAEFEGAPAGYAAYHYARRHNTEAELQSSYMLKETQGRGIGTAPLRRIADRLVAEGTGSMCVGYEPGNPYKRFYARHGAVEINPHWAYWPDLLVIGAYAASTLRLRGCGPPAVRAAPWHGSHRL